MKGSITGTCAFLLAGSLIGSVITAASAADTIKLADIEPMSGPMASAGDDSNKHLQFLVDRINEEGGVAGGKKLELLLYDGKFNAQEVLIAAQKAIDAGARFITNSNGTSTNLALVEFINKHNRREPNNQVLMLDTMTYGPELTDNKCSEWMFHYLPNVNMVLQALVGSFKSQPVKKVYLINQNYSFGQAIAAEAKKLIAERAPQVQIVGDDLHPVATVKDFSPYIAKIKASGADSVITGNWGNDIILLLKQAAEQELHVSWYAFNGNNLGVPTAVGKTGEGTLKAMLEWDQDSPPPDLAKLADAFKAKYHYDFVFYQDKIMLDMLKTALNKVGSADAAPVAKALSSMSLDTDAGDWVMRPQDHQVSSPIFLATFTSKAKRDLENTGLGFETYAKVPRAETLTPVQCTVTAQD